MIRFDAFTKRYGGARPAVDRLTFDVAGGEVVALLGPNGSGKTTSLKAAAGLITPSSGRVLLGDPGRPSSEASARTLLSYLPQRVAFPEALTGREVVEFYRRLRGLEPARTAGALRFASLNGASDRGVGTYSGGMMQRLGLAVAVLPDSPVLLLDEPTAALDPDGLSAFYGLVEERRRAGRTVLFTSHQLGDAERLADRFAILVNGRLAAVLSGADLRERLSVRGRLRLRLDSWPSGLEAAVRTIAPASSREDGELIVPGPPSVRPRVIDAVRALGASVQSLSTEEGRLDGLYRELVESPPEAS
jgi:Cu-processing system ATP-binding protein